MFLLLLLDLVAAVPPSGFTQASLTEPAAGATILLEFSALKDDAKIAACRSAILGNSANLWSSDSPCFKNGDEPDRIKSVSGYQTVVDSLSDATWPKPSGWNPPNNKYCVAGAVTDISTTGWVFKAYEPASSSFLESTCDLSKPLNNGGSQVTWTKTTGFKDGKTIVLFSKLAAPAGSCPVVMTLSSTLVQTDTTCGSSDADIITPGKCHGMAQLSTGAWEVQSQKVDGSASYLTATRYDGFDCTGVSQFAGCAVPGSPGVCSQTAKTTSTILGDITLYYNSRATYFGTNCMASVTGLSGATTCTSNAFAITVGLSALISMFLF